MSARLHRPLSVALAAACALASTSAHAQAVDADDVPPKAAPAPPPPPPPRRIVPQLDDPEPVSRDGPVYYVPPGGRYLPPGWTEADLPPVEPPRKREALAPDDPRRTPRRYKLLVAGAVTLAGSYLASVSLGGFVGREPLWALPFAGPILASQRPGGSSQLGAAIIATGAQLTGAVLTVVGSVIAFRQQPPAARRLSWSISPVVSPDLAGASVWGRF